MNLKRNLRKQSLSRLCFLGEYLLVQSERLQAVGTCGIHGRASDRVGLCNRKGPVPAKLLTSELCFENQVEENVEDH
jgi:hypothetical protein